MYSARVEGRREFTSRGVHGHAMLHHGCEGVEGDGDVFNG